MTTGADRDSIMALDDIIFTPQCATYNGTIPTPHTESTTPYTGPSTTANTAITTSYTGPTTTTPIGNEFFSRRIK